MLRVLFVLSSFLLFGPAAIAADRSALPVSPEPALVLSGPGTILTSSSSSLAPMAPARAAADTFFLYGGPDHPTEGKFQLVDEATPDWGSGNGLPGGYGGGPAAWSPVDLTFQTDYWHRDTFNAANLNDQGTGNHAMWSGLAADDPRTAAWVTAPGYGNNWFDVLIHESEPVDDPSAGQVVSLDFFFNHDLEPGFDFLSVEYDSAGTWTQVYATDGTNADSLGVFAAPGVQFSGVQTGSIDYAGNDYGGEFGDRIRIRLLVESDGGWSDEDGYWPTLAGAAQVDDISLTTSLGSASEDFEGTGPWLFEPWQSPFAGDFADVYPAFSDPDPCRFADSPTIGFLDYGQIVRNGPGVDGTTATGGSTSPGSEYGIPGNFVFNYTGGITLGEASVLNEIWSPDIAWDLPGPEDDDPAMAGTYLRFSVWNHLPVINGIFFVWHVRSALPGEEHGNWTSRSFVYHGTSTGYWSNERFDTTDLMQPGAERVQLSLGGWDYAEIFGFPGTAATPSPVFDNVGFAKYRIAGPAIATRNIDLAQDGFPVSGSFDLSTASGRDALDVPFDMARDVNTGSTINAPGDSVIADVAALIPGTSVTDVRMVWALDTNPVFEDALRSAPARARDENVVAGAAGTVWTGEVEADSARSRYSGAVVEGRFFVDLPDQDFLYPGDVLHYYLQATDSDGRTSTLPADVSGFGQFGAYAVYDRTFTVRALPSVRDVSGAQPAILLINEFGRRGEEAEMLSAFIGNGLREGIEFDTYTVQGPSSRVSNGIGSAGAHGATVAQLAGYDALFHFSGNLPRGVLSNGDTSSASNEKGNDIGLLEQWHLLSGGRSMAYFGDHIASDTAYSSPEGQSYVANVMGVDVLGEDVGVVLGGQTSPRVIADPPFLPGWTTGFVAFGGCPGLRQFDQIQPLAGAVAGHWFLDASGNPVTDPGGGAASVVYQKATGIDVTFPYSIGAIRDDTARRVVPARADLIGELLTYFGLGPRICDPIPCTEAPPAPRVVLDVFPNPFNPVTTVEFTAAAGARGSVKVYNLRGELVRTLHTGEFRSQRFEWDGTDDRGASVASGVYLVHAEDGSNRQTAKVALVK